MNKQEYNEWVEDMELLPKSAIIKFLGDRNEDVSKLETRLEEAVEWIKKGGHSQQCNIFHQPVEECTCGYEQILKELTGGNK
jgi:hypothetical protein